jgi:hypothetical protein
MTTYTLTLSEKELHIIGAGLVHIPYGQVVDLITNIHMQVMQQQLPKSEDTPKE